MIGCNCRIRRCPVKHQSNATAGYSREDLEAGALRGRDMTPAEHYPAEDRSWEELHERGVCTPFQKEYIRKDGTRVPVLVGRALFDPAGPSWVCFVQDLSRIKKVEEELRETDRLKDEFLATLAHELRNPLAPIRNAVQLLLYGSARFGTSWRPCRA